MIYVNNNRGSGGFFGGLGCLVFGALILVGIFYMLRGLYALIWWAAPALFVLALIINWRVVANTGKWIFEMFQTRPLSALVITAVSIYLFPLLTLFWFLSALGAKRITRMQEEFGRQWGGPFGMSGNPREQETEFVEFEEIESKPINKQPTGNTTEWPPEPEKKDKKPDNPYDQVFE